MNEEISLLDRIDRIIGSDDFNLPVFSDIAIKIRNMMSSENFEIQEVVRVISSDQSLASEVLRVANSPFYAGLTKIATLREAAVRMGAKQLADLVMVASERNNYRASDKEVQALLNKLWRHAVGVALASQWLAKKLGYADRLNEALLGGLIHDIGKLAVLKVVDQLKVKEGLSFPVEFVMEVVNSVHAQQGYKLAQRWRLPDNYCVIVRDHHLEEVDQINSVLLIVKVADAACNKLGIGINLDASIELAVLPEAHALGIGEVMLAELEIMLEDTLQMAAG
ncbi:MAG: HDOD domain-containing protein [Desulfobulbaceae bacterium]|nr:HDOD domain-containing protein [Desulfobulbaceae bacterium]